MVIFQRGVAWRAVMLLVTPLVVGGSLLWQFQALVAPGERAEVAATLAQGAPPAGISPEEWQAVSVEFEGITDSTFRCGTEEMPAYWRLLKWNVRQPESDGDQHEFRFVSFNELVNRPNKWRGRPVQVDLHVCRILEYAAPENNLGIERLYEVWGWSEDSRGSLYVVVTPELPPRMSVGESVSERAIVSGYFYKVQGYLAAGSASQSSSSAAPLIIGRMSRWDAPVAAFAKTNELWFVGAGLLLAASFIALLSQRPLFRSRFRERLDTKATAKLETWLDSNPMGSEFA